MGKTVRGIRDKKNPYARYMEQKRYKRLEKQEFQYLKCIMRDGHVFEVIPNFVISGIPVFITGEKNTTRICTQCEFKELLDGVDIGIKVASIEDFKAMKKRYLFSGLSNNNKKKLSPEEKINKWKLKTKGF